MRAFARLSIAVFGLSLIAGVAAAQDAAPRIRIDDLNLATTQGAAEFDARVRRVARTACAGRSPLQAVACREIVKREFHDALPAAHRGDYARARSGVRLRAEVRVHSA